MRVRDRESESARQRVRYASCRYAARRPLWAKTGHVATLTEGKILWNASEI